MVINCKRCGKIFNSFNDIKLCAECTKEDNEVFKTIKEYIYQNPSATISEVSRALQVSINRIKRYLKEGRLEIIEKHNLFLECEKCGVAIQSGRYCKTCVKEFFDELKSVEKEEGNTGSARDLGNRGFLYS